MTLCCSTCRRLVGLMRLPASLLDRFYPAATCVDDGRCFGIGNAFRDQCDYSVVGVVADVGVHRVGPLAEAKGIVDSGDVNRPGFARGLLV